MGDSGEDLGRGIESAVTGILPDTHEIFGGDP
jgi:hypothetical protein